MDSQWGRIDADGTVYVKTAEGEREIGSWQAGDAEAGLRFYQLRYADLAAEVGVLEQRLKSGAGDPAAASTQATALTQRLGEVAAIGDLDALRVRLDAVCGVAATLAGERAEQRQQAKAQAVAAKEKLLVEAEQIAESATSWKVSGDRLRTIVDEWKQIKGVDRRTDEAMWKRFAAARDAFGRRRGQHFAQLDTERDAAKRVKEKLIARAEELAKSSDWKQTAEAMRDLMNEWKAAGRAGRGDEDELWKQFRAAQDGFFARRSEQFAERDTEQSDNQRKKEALIAEAERIDIADPRAAQAAMRELQARFDEVGHVPRQAIRPIDDRMRAAEQRVRDAADAQWRAGAAESNPFLTALKERLSEAEAKLERARKAGDPGRIAKAEAEVEQRRALIPG